MPCLCLTKACFSLLLSLSLNTFQLIPTLCSVFPFQLSAFRPSWVPLWVSPLPVQLGLIPLCLPVSQSCDGPCLSRLLQYGEHCQLTQECKQWTRSVFVPTAMRPCTRLLALIQSWVKNAAGYSRWSLALRKWRSRSIPRPDKIYNLHWDLFPAEGARKMVMKLRGDLLG